MIATIAIQYTGLAWKANAGTNSRCATRLAKLISGLSADAVPFPRTEVVVLYQKERRAPNDHADFRQAVLVLDRAWLRTALQPQPSRTSVTWISL